MKTQRVADMLGIDSKTVTNWSDNPLLNKFFSEPARSEGRKRIFGESDVLVLNTIRVARETNTDWPEIAQLLETGYRDADLPPSAFVGKTTAAISQYSKLALAVQRAAELEEQVADLEVEIERKDEIIGDLREELGILKGMMRANGIDPKTGKPISDL